MPLRVLISAAALLGSLGAASLATADVLAHEQFSYADSLIVGHTPTPGPGAAWVAHTDEGNTPIQVVNQAAVLVQGSGSGGREDVNLGFPMRSTTDTTYARFDFLLPSGQTVNPDLHGMMFAHLKSDRPTNHFRANTGVLAPTGGGDFVLAINANGIRLDEGIAWPVELSFDTVYRLVTNWNAETGEAKLWLNPENESSPFISHTGHSKLQALESFALRQSSDYFGTQTIDNIVVATSFAEALSGMASSGLLGDYNGNGTVDAADYSVWRDAVTSRSTTLLNDPTPGTVDESDFGYWRDHFGQPQGGGASGGTAAMIPEPSAMLLALTGIALLSSGRANTVADFNGRFDSTWSSNTSVTCCLRSAKTAP